ncbi:MAG: Lar family restriction alleviation protein [Synergistaceae bacterium]|nr:Lar family restriction alleviation protein [Synergistaceae bacterium]
MIAMAEYLKPCPFCGSRAVGLVDDNYSNYWVQCSHCFAQTDAYFNRHDAVDAWNNRAEKTSNINADAWDDALRALIRAVSDISNLVKGCEG